VAPRNEFYDCNVCLTDILERQTLFKPFIRAICDVQARVKERTRPGDFSFPCVKETPPERLPLNCGLSDGSEGEGGEVVLAPRAPIRHRVSEFHSARVELTDDGQQLTQRGRADKWLNGEGQSPNSSFLGPCLLCDRRRGNVDCHEGGGAQARNPTAVSTGINQGRGEIHDKAVPFRTRAEVFSASVLSVCDVSELRNDRRWRPDKSWLAGRRT